MDIALRCPRRVQRRNSFDCRCRSDILSARYCAGGDGAARRAYHRAKHVQRFIAGFGRAGGMSPGGTKERPIPASLVNRGDSVVPAGLFAAPLRTPALKRWAIVTRSLRDNAPAEFPKGISLAQTFRRQTANRYGSLSRQS